ncbi:hypothetical protein Tco_1471471 [Tanacetum coccineum]
MTEVIYLDSIQASVYPNEYGFKIAKVRQLKRCSQDCEAKVFERRSNCTLLNQFSSSRMISGVKAQLKIKTCDRCRCVPHLVTAILIVYVESTPPEEHHQVVVLLSVDQSHSLLARNLLWGATPALRRRIL